MSSPPKLHCSRSVCLSVVCLTVNVWWICVWVQCAASHVQQPWQLVTNVAGLCRPQFRLHVHDTTTVSTRVMPNEQWFSCWCFYIAQLKLMAMVHTCAQCTHTHTPSPLSRTTWVSRYQKGKTSLDLSEARIDGVLGWHCHQLDHMRTVCTSLQTDNHANTSSVNFWHNRSSTVLFCIQSGNNRGRDADSRRYDTIRYEMLF